MDFPTSPKWLAVYAGAGLAVVAAVRVASLATGDARLDRWSLRARAAWWGWRRGYDARILMGMMHTEGAAWLAPQLGDTADYTRGPSVGPLQMSRGTAIERGITSASTSYDGWAAWADPAHEATTFGWGAEEFARCWSRAGGDLRTALRLYNGADSYAVKTINFLAATYPGAFTPITEE